MGDIKQTQILFLDTKLCIFSIVTSETCRYDPIKGLVQQG